MKEEPTDSPQGKKRKSTSNGAKKEPKVKKPKKEREPSPEKWEWWHETPEERQKREESGEKWRTLEHMVSSSIDMTSL